MEALLNEIDERLSNRFVVLEGNTNDGVLYVKDRESGIHYSITVAECAE